MDCEADPMYEPVSPRSEPGEVVVRPATAADLPALVAIEEASFPSPWSERLLAGELRQPDASYLVASIEGQVVGFVGTWFVLDEAHICTLAVAPQWRRRGLGELLVLAALEDAVSRGATMAHLEYRLGNRAAARLYEKLGFERVGVRRGYYSDTNEDAVLARLDGLNEPAVQAFLDAAWERWRHERGLRVVRA